MKNPTVVLKFLLSVFLTTQVLFAVSDIDLAITSGFSLKITGESAGDRLGTSLTFGNLDGDSFKDLLIGAAYKDNAGYVYILYGKEYSAGLPTTGVEKSINSFINFVTIKSSVTGDTAGFSLVCSDINGDNKDDIIIGAPGSGNGLGKVYILYGQTFSGTLTLPGAADIIISGEPIEAGGELGEADNSGYSLASGDVNGDGIADIMVGAPYADYSYHGGREDCGKTYIILGSTYLPNSIGLADADIKVIGAEAEDYLGWSIASGDINNDGYDDISLGARGADGPDNTRADGSGEVYVIYGSSTIGQNATYDLYQTTAYDMIIYGKYGSSDPSAQPGDNLGEYVAMGDYNGDGYSDIIMSADDALADGDRPHAGEVYFIYGSGNLPSSWDLNTDPDLIIYGGEEGLPGEYGKTGDICGDTLAIGDVTGDGKAELLLNARYADAKDNLKPNAGEVYLILGRTSFSGKVDVSTAAANRPDMVIYGANSGDETGHLALASGKFDNDDIGDLAIGVQLGETMPALESQGIVYVLSGSKFVPTPPELSISTPVAGAILSGTFSILGTASSDLGINHVNFSIDNVIVSTDTTAPYSYNWDTTKYSDGEHDINLKATDEVGTGSWAQVTVTVDNPPPIVTGLTVLDSRKGRQLNLNWTASSVSDLAGYQLWRTSGNIYTLISLEESATYYINTSLLDGVTYTYLIKAVDDAGQASSSSTLVSAFPTDKLAPGAPVLTINDPGTGDATYVVWETEEDDIGSFKLYYSSFSCSVSSKTYLLELSSSSRSYYHSGLIAATYYYQIKAVDIAGNESNISTEASKYIIDKGYPGPPGNLIVKDNPEDDGTRLLLSWDLSFDDGAGDNDVTGYRLYRSTYPGGYQLILSTSSGRYNCIDSGLTLNSTYYYLVRSWDGAYESINSNIVNAYPYDNLPPATPTGISVIDSATEGSISINWNLNSEADIYGYRIYRALVTGTIYDKAIVATVLNPTTYFIDTQLNNYVTYFYQLTAIDTSGLASSASSEIYAFATDHIAPSAPPLSLNVSGKYLNIEEYPSDYADGKINISWVYSGETLSYFNLYRSSFSSAVTLKTLIAELDGNTTFYVDNGLYPNLTYYYSVKLSDLYGNASTSSEFSICLIPGIKYLPTVEGTVKIGNNFLRPGSGKKSIIYYKVGSSKNVKINVYSLAGKIIRTLVNENKPAGTYYCEWDATDESGAYVGSGIYFVAVNAGGDVSVKRIAVVR